MCNTHNENNTWFLLVCNICNIFNLGGEYLPQLCNGSEKQSYLAGFAQCRRTLQIRVFQTRFCAVGFFKL